MAQANQPSTGETETVLRFLADAGVDCLLEEAPVDRFAETRRYAERVAAPAAGRQPAAPAGTAAPPNDPPVRAPQAGPPGDRRVAVPDEAALLDARAAAAEAATLDELKATLSAFTGCNLRNGAKNTVFARGNPEAGIMFVGEAPGRDEDIQGLPFVGRAGRMLDRMLTAIGLDEATAYITNMIAWRPPGNRNPTPHEIELCRPFIERHIVLADPKLIVFLGNVSNKALMKTNRGILSARGNWGEYPIGERAIPVMPTLHPAYLLRNPAHKRLAWQDFLEIRIRLEAVSASR